MLSNALTSAQSGLTAFLEKMNVHSNNIANIATNGFKSDEVNIEEGIDNDVNATVGKNEPEEARVNNISTNRNTEVIEKSNVDLVREVVGSMVAQRGYEANLKVFESADHMNKQVIDLFS